MTKRLLLAAAALAAAFAATGCESAPLERPYEYDVYDEREAVGGYPGGEEPPAPSPSAYGGMSDASGTAAPAPPPGDQVQARGDDLAGLDLAWAPPTEDGPQGGNGGQGNQGNQPGNQGNNQGNQQPPAGGGGPLLIYTGELTLGVYDVTQTQRAVIAIGRELNGFLSYQDDARVTIRVPARRFHDAIERIAQVGDVIHRNIQAQDVGEEFRDIVVRLRNAEAVRDRLERLLQDARGVDEALRVQQELARVTETIEQFKGRLRFLQDRVSFSTVTVLFQPRPVESIGEPDVFRLPFEWLDTLGLPTLLDLR